MSNIALEKENLKRPSGVRGKIARFFKAYGWSYFFVLPSFTVFTVFILIPVLWALVISFQNYDFAWDGTWAGFSNYVRAFTTENGVFLRAIEHTLFYTIITVTANVLIALALASLIQGRSKHWKTFFLAAYYLPAVTSVVIIAITWRWIYNSEYGLLNYLLGLVHLPAVRWLSDPNLVLGSITLSTVLTVPATGVVLFNAAMGSIPTEFYEAARIDGAGPFRRWWHITLPLIKPTTLYLVVLYTIASFEVFEKVFVMIPAGVGDSAQVIVTQIYENGFQQFRYGLASAQAFVLFLMIAAVAVVQFRVFKTDVEY
ncbi:multiple sugar transport system permease protein [Thermosporothrix hazakensis]|jgi:multiple sugar transport system permease protein|uniref:Multiple sugar transport system permease protein n=2 Tax=Thermosporothrix TaxID=768650 RepID=A0A326U8V8_THEHA|nr:sugar ABC transporter permease [Thermosporothrix hazakensis]PZW32025.1 multiple sugar transport system permease protein [Thermosporothrix hazakensis]BBH91502.1 sugar transport system [Thermosporothrix sp. COM3]GCE49647.1 sugar transport system [Thermosporothrix hazakensis]